MLKKALFVVVGVVIVGGLMFGSSAIHMARDFVSGARNFGDSMVSTEAKISHTRKDIKALDKDIKGLYHDIAKEEVRCEDLENEVSTKREALSTLTSHMQVLNSHLKTSPSQLYTATNDKEYTPNQIKRDLSTSVKRYKSQSMMLTALEKQLDTRVAILTSAKEQLEKTKRIKAELMSEVEALEAEHAMNEVAKITSDFNLDNSRIANAKEAVKKLRTEIRVEGNLVNQMQSADSIPTESIETEDLDNITARVDALIGNDTGVVQK